MRSLHYEIALPDAYDMGQIRERVQQRGHLFEDVQGLAFKAFLIQSRAEGARRNVYAPLYFWNSHEALSAFTVGPLFAGLIESFGRPSAIDQQVLGFDIVDASIEPTIATIETTQMEPSALPAAMHRIEDAHHRTTLSTPGLFAAATLLDTREWTVSRARLWADAQCVRGVAAHAERFTVLRTVGPALTPHRQADFAT